MHTPSAPSQEQLAKTLGAVEGPSLLVVGTVATLGIVGLVTAALIFWPKPEETKRRVRARKPLGEPTRITHQQRRKKKKARRARLSVPKRRRARRISKNVVHEDRDDDYLDVSADDVVDAA